MAHITFIRVNIHLMSGGFFSQLIELFQRLFSYIISNSCSLCVDFNRLALLGFRSFSLDENNVVRLYVSISVFFPPEWIQFNFSIIPSLWPIVVHSRCPVYYICILSCTLLHLTAFSAFNTFCTLNNGMPPVCLLWIVRIVVVALQYIPISMRPLSRPCNNKCKNANLPIPSTSRGNLI